MIQQGKVQVEQPPSYTDSLSLCTGPPGARGTAGPPGDKKFPARVKRSATPVHYPYVEDIGRQDDGPPFKNPDLQPRAGVLVPESIRGEAASALS